jgi:hypothetical protein
MIASVKTSLIFLLMVMLVIPAGGTLVVSVPAKTGLVLCADKRTYDPLRGDQDNATKIHQLKTFVAFASTGTATFVDRFTFADLFNADTITEDFFKTHSVTADLMAFGNTLSEGFGRFLLSRPSSDWPPTANTLANAVFQIPISYITTADEPQTVVMTVMYTNRVPVPEVRFEARTFSVIEPHGFGNPAVWNELAEGSDARFDADRKNPILSKVLSQLKRFDRQTITVDEGLGFAKEMIKVTSAKTHLIENSTFHVGPTCDCAVIDYQTGFTWVSEK